MACEAVTSGRTGWIIGRALLGAIAVVVVGCGPSEPGDGENVAGATARLLAADVDTGLRGNEPHLVVSPIDPQIVAVAAFETIVLSFDGGKNFNVSVTPPLPFGYGNDGGGDPVMAFDGQGRLFFSFLDVLQNTMNAKFGGADMFIQQIDVRAPSVLPAGATRLLDASGVDCGTAGANAAQCPMNVSQSLGLGAFNDANPNGRFSDKQWLAADARPACPNPAPARTTRTCSTFRNNLYLVWTDFPPPSGGPRLLRVASSPDQGATWTTRVLSTPSEGFTQQADIAVAANGDVWAVYHAQPGFFLNGAGNPDGTSGRIIAVRSITGTAAGFTAKSTPFAAGQADISFNVKQCPCPGSFCQSNTGMACTLSSTNCPGTPGCECPMNDCTPAASCANTPIPGFQGCARRLDPNLRTLTQGSAAPFVVVDPNNPENIAVFASDDPDPTVVGDNFDVRYVTARDAASAASPAWSSPQPVNPSGGGLPATNQIFPTAIGRLSDQCVALAYYDDRNMGTGSFGTSLLDVFVTVTPNLWPSSGTVAWQSEIQINHFAFDPDLGFGGAGFHPYCAANAPATCTEPAGWVPTSRMGEYFGLAPADGVAWTGNFGNRQGILFNFSDGVAPVVTPPADVTVNTCTPPASALGTASAADICGKAPLGTPVSDFSGVLQPGPNTVNWTVTDGAENPSMATQTVTVVDTQPPVITCPANQTAECVGGSASVNFGNATATDDCAVASVACLPPSGSSFPLGNSTVACTATDTSSNSSGCNFNVAVADTTPPVVTTEGAGQLWPPDHKYVTKTLDNCGVAINDQCQGMISLGSAHPLITCITSDEVENDGGDGNTAQDMIIVNATTVSLRGERAGNQDGRVYKIHFQVSDAAGNIGTGVCEVSVPHDQGAGSAAVDSGVHFSVGSCI